MLKKVLTSVAVSATLTGTAVAQDAEAPAYLVAALKVSDLNAYFESYGGRVFPMLDAAGAQVLVGTPTVKTLEGSYAATWTAIVRFPSMAALDAWYASAEYQAIAPNRRALSDNDTSILIAAPAFSMPQK